MFAGLSSSIGLVRAGKLKALATTGAKRSAVAANLPTVIEGGLPGFEATSWFGAMFRPRRRKPSSFA
jgi:tripartite-type tricarboxylate transporter receptor subunit TctC